MSLGQVHSALNRLKNVLPRSSLDALYGVAELIQTPEFEIGWLVRLLGWLGDLMFGGWLVCLNARVIVLMVG